MERERFWEEFVARSILLPAALLHQEKMSPFSLPGCVFLKASAVSQPICGCAALSRTVLTVKLGCLVLAAGSTSFKRQICGQFPFVVHSPKRWDVVCKRVEQVEGHRSHKLEATTILLVGSKATGRD